MEKGISKYWTPEAEEKFQRDIESCGTFAMRHWLMTIRGIFKYDGRTKQAKRDIAEARLRIATATDDELEQLATLERELMGESKYMEMVALIGTHKERRAKIREKGIKRSDLE